MRVPALPLAGESDGAGQVARVRQAEAHARAIALSIGRRFGTIARKCDVQRCTFGFRRRSKNY